MMMMMMMLLRLPCASEQAQMQEYKVLIEFAIPPPHQTNARSTSHRTIIISSNKIIHRQKVAALSLDGSCLCLYAFGINSTTSGMVGKLYRIS